MSEHDLIDPMLDMFIFETTQNIEQLEQLIISSEKASSYSKEAINEIFRIMHTIKGSSAMMEYNNISSLAHKIEDLFFYIREKNPQQYDCGAISDNILASIDFISGEMEKIKAGEPSEILAESLMSRTSEILDTLKKSNGDDQKRKTKGEKAKKPDPEQQQDKASQNSNPYKVVFYFEDGCEMENIRAFNLIYQLKEIADEIHYMPEDIIDDDDSINVIREQGFIIHFKSGQSYDEIHHFFSKAVFMKDFELSDDGVLELENKPEKILVSFLESEPSDKNKEETPCSDTQEKNSEKPLEMMAAQKETTSTVPQSIISVSVDKLDRLMDLIGELVITGAMVTQNPDLKDLVLTNFTKSARQLQKITNEIQDLAMSVRMVPLATTFQKMNRILRDMSKKLSKDVRLQIIGEETEVDKNIIDHLSDPLMHLVRNAMDHGIESLEERRALGKPDAGTVTLGARNEGKEVYITVQDDGGGMDKSKIYQKAYKNGLTTKTEAELTEKEILSFIFLPGFSMNETVTEFSGRGVGMDVVVKNIEKVGGKVDIDSVMGKGTSVNIKIPLTVAIIDGMIITVGNASYTIPTISIKESFRPKGNEVLTDLDGNELIMIRGNCYPIYRLHKEFCIQKAITTLNEGIMLMVEDENTSACIFADALIGQQQVVVKALPNYIKKVKGLAGCTLLGDGNISLIIDVGMMLSHGKERR